MLIFSVFSEDLQNMHFSLCFMLFQIVFKLVNVLWIGSLGYFVVSTLLAWYGLQKDFLRDDAG